jgi:hypothetical protein
MVKINPSVTLELKHGQKVTIELEEAVQIIKGLTKFVQDGGYSDTINLQSIQKRKKRKESTEKAKIPHMSEEKRMAILEHLEKQLSLKPKTISNLLRGISYVPNYLPHIRRMIESQRNVARKRIGKRTFYYRSRRSR